MSGEEELNSNAILVVDLSLKPLYFYERGSGFITLF